MDIDILIGILLVVFSLGILTYMVLWARWIINRIASKGFGSARKIIKEIRNG